METERLVLRQFCQDDAAFIRELLNTPGWLQYIGYRGIKTLQDAEQYLVNGPMKSYEQHGFGLYMVVLKDGHVPIGMCGLIKRDTLQHVDIGFAFLPAYMGKGYGYEAAAETLAYATDVLRHEKVLAITLPGNAASIALLNKIGMRPQGNMHMGDEELILFSN